MTGEGKGLAKETESDRNKIGEDIWCARLRLARSLSLSALWLLDLENGNNDILSPPAPQSHQIELLNL